METVLEMESHDFKMITLKLVLTIVSHAKSRVAGGGWMEWDTLTVLGVSQRLQITRRRKSRKSGVKKSNHTLTRGDQN